ncbi:MAG TPA: glutathione S-transferase family protein [Candidatus Binatia bacterium]|nr:glutathione S-transferase family protein [Candidatus Binatia bacterium]
MATPYTLYVMSNSPYSDKIRMYLRLKRLPVVEVRENIRNREAVLKARTGRTMVPVVITPDDEAMNESTNITRRLEAAIPSPALRPADPGRRGFDALVEEYADEWIVRVMLASRWLHGPDAEQNKTVIATDMTCGAGEVEVALAKELFPQGITATLPPMGATPETLGFLLDDLGGLVTDLDALFARHRFIGGAEPTVADLALYGQLNQIRRDPTGRTIVGDPARPHGRWLRDVERRADGEAAEGAGDAPPDAEALAPLARRIASTYLRFSVGNAKALEQAPKGPLVVALADGVPFQAARAGYNRKCLQALLGELEEAIAAAGKLVGDAADRPVLTELRGLGPLLAPYPSLARAAA